MAVINRAFAQIAGALYGLESKGVLAEDYPFNQEVALKEMTAKINCEILAKVTEREVDDRKHYGKVREGLARRKG
ncbi:MAG TPA: hypothetical protein VIB39_18410 [Candidatus Angelobacter sp.]|jgi:hypothetical protein